MNIRRARPAVIARRWIVAVAATISIVIPISAASQPSVAATARVHTASSSSQSSVNAQSPCEEFDWYLQNSSHYAAGMDLNNDHYVAVHDRTAIAAQQRWNFCRVGINSHGLPIFTLKVKAGQEDVGKCAVSTGSYFKYGSCSSNGTDFTELPAAGGKGFLLASRYILNTQHRTKVITVSAPRNNYRLFLASTGTDWQLWNALPCNSITSC